MAEQESRARRHEAHPELTPSELEDHERIRRDEREIRRDESQIRRLSEVLRFADLMAVMMVLATVFSAYATWRTASVTSQVFAIADRPFLGVQQVHFEALDSPHPMIAVDLRNFGQLPALDAIANVHALVEGKVIKTPTGEMSSIDAGIVPPNVPYFVYAYLTPDLYQQVTSGKSNLQVHVTLMYKGPRQQAEYCYFERIIYDYRSASFRMAGGNDRCGSDVF
jgi:hypothetical protein